MPGFPTHIVGTPTIRGKAQRYEGSREDKDRASYGKEGWAEGEGTMYRAPTKEKDGEVNSPLQRLRMAA